MMRTPRPWPGVLPLLLIALVSIGAGCDRRTPQPKASAPPAVNVAQPEVRPIQEYDEFTGRTAAVESVEVRPKVSGYIMEIPFKDGQEVSKGDLLFQIDPRPFQVDLESYTARLSAANATLAVAEASVQRYVEMRKTDAASQKELDEAIARRDQASSNAAQAQAGIDQAKLNLEYARITSPIDGRISKPELTVGNLVRADALLTTIVSIKPVYIYFDIDERAAQRYRKVINDAKLTVADLYKLNVPVYAALGTDDSFPFQGILDFIDNQTDPSTGTLKARGVFPNDNYMLVAGEFARVRTRHGQQQDMMLIPDRAIARNQDRRYVVVVDDKHIAQLRPVQVGNVHSGMRVITAGLKADEWIIVDGLQRARPGKPVTPTRLQAAAPATAPVAAMPVGTQEPF